MTTALAEPTDTKARAALATLEQERTRAAEAAARRAAFVATVEGAALARTLPLLQRATGGARTALPILKHVLIVAGAGELTLTATDLSHTFVTTVPADVQAPGAYTVPLALLSDFVGKLASGPVTLRGAADALTVQAGADGKTRCRIKGADAEEFPPVPAIADPVAVALTGAALRQITDLVGIAAANDETRPVLTGVHLCLAPGAPLAAEASDGHRLAVLPAVAGTLVPEDDGATKIDAIVPAADLALAARYVPAKGEAAVTLEVARDPAKRNGLRLVLPAAADNAHGPLHVTLRLMEGQFPDLSRVIPKAPTTTVTVDRAALRRAVECVAPFARDAANVVRLAITDGLPGAVAVTATSGGIGDGGDEIAADVEGEATSVSFSAPYLLTALAAPGERAVLRLNGPLSPALFTTEELPDYVHVVMPMHAVH